MRRPKPPPLRNKVDLSDRAQVRLVKRRLRLTDAQLSEIVQRIGNSLSAIGKEVALRRSKPSAEREVPAAAIASVKETTVTGSGAIEPTA